jgi:type I restriction enzyme S subunit
MKPGYKQTEVGVIPEEWEVKPLGHLIKLQAGYSFRSENFSDVGIPVIRISDIQDGLVTTDGAVCHPSFKIDDDFVVKNEDFLVAMSGATTGKVGVFHGPKPAYQNQRVGRFVVRDDNRTSQLFVGQLVRSSWFGSRLSVLLEQGAQPNVSGRQIESLLFSVPSQLSEQRAIATALSDVDALLGGLDRLIAKKRDLKQAAMQQLLTGQTRLPGFQGEWEVAPLGQEIEGLDAGVSVNSSDEGLGSYEHESAVLKTSAISGGQFLPHESKSIAPNDIGRAKLNPRKDTIIISRMNTPDLVGECGYVFADFPTVFLPDRLWMTRIRNGSDVCVQWLNYLLSSKPYKTRIKSFATGTSGSMKNIAKDTLLSMLVPYPKSPEQRAIAKVLSEMDLELAALEQRREKTQALKQGMMQELLTGRTRLV